MLKISRILNVCIFTTILFGLLMVVYLIATPYIYGVNSNGKKINNDRIYDDIYNIIARKYEIILYEDKEELYNLYSYNNKDAISKFINSEKYDEIVEQHQETKIKEIQELSNTVFAVNIKVIYRDNEFLEEKIIVKLSNKRAIILNDNGL